MRKHLLTFLQLFTFLTILLIAPRCHAQIGTWTALKNLEPNQGAGIMMLLTDGRVLCQSVKDSEAGWDILTPDSTGSYVNGTWTTAASMNQWRLFFSSQVLPSGKVFVAGGEYGPGDTAGEIYDPVADTWTRTSPVTDTINIYDGNSELLPNGQVLVGAQSGPNPSNDDLFYNPVNNQWAIAPIAPLNHDEAQWLKLPDSSILFIGINTLSSCRYRPQTNSWVMDSNVPDSIFDAYGGESGCALMLPNGKAIFFGAEIHNAIYTPSGDSNPGRWAVADSFPTIGTNPVGQTDAPGAMMVNGHILLSVAPVGNGPNNEFRNPAYFLEYNYLTDSFTQVTSIIPGMGADSIAGNTCSNVTFLDLPDGNVLMVCSQNDTNSMQYYVYTPGSGPIPQGKPTIDHIIPQTYPYYKITGKLFNGISEGAAFGDDLQMSSNYPLVRLKSSTGRVYYCKTTNWNRLGAVRTDSLEDTATFEVPAGLPPGSYSLVVVANGFASNPTVYNTPAGIQTISNSAGIKIYPNPSNGVFTASIKNCGTEITNRILVYNMLGQEVYSQSNIKNSTFKIDLSTQPSGLYLYRVSDENGNILSQGKLEIQK